MTFLACLGALWIGMFVYFVVKYTRAEWLKLRDAKRAAARVKMLDEAVTRSAPIASTAEAVAPAGPFEQAATEHLRWVIQCNEWNRLVTSVPPVRFQPVNYPETRQ